eukprot:3554204-Rhodomonas_salina.1
MAEEIEAESEGSFDQSAREDSGSDFEPGPLVTPYLCPVLRCIRACHFTLHVLFSLCISTF